MVNTFVNVSLMSVVRMPLIVSAKEYYERSQDGCRVKGSTKSLNIVSFAITMDVTKGLSV